MKWDFKMVILIDMCTCSCSCTF